MKDVIRGKHFSIMDPQHVNTVIYEINKNEDNSKKSGPKLTLDRLEYVEELIGEKKKKTFYINDPKKDGNFLAILSFGKEKVVINNGVLDGNKVLISKKPIPFKFKNLYSEEPMEYKEFQYTPNLKRPITIIDPETTEEIKPTLYFDEETNEVKGKCKLRPHKSYFAFEIREEGNEFQFVGGNPVVE